MATSQAPPDIKQVLLGAQRLIDNGMLDAAAQLLKSNGLKHIIKSGRIIDVNDITEEWLERFITRNVKMLALKDQVRKLSKVNDEVLIAGETGTGKELLAHALHGNRQGEFKALNCAGLPEHLIESELFGHVRGAFTGATSDKVGLTVASKYGTLFLDEIGELPMQAQSKLLRVIQEKKVRPVGSNEEKEITCRFVFATNKNLSDMCKEGTFRLDLYARICVFELDTLSLKDRPEDIVPILYSLKLPDIICANLDSSLIDLRFNVRSLQMIVKKYNVLGIIPPTKKEHLL